jgi:hypothetical protein
MESCSRLNASSRRACWRQSESSVGASIGRVVVARTSATWQKTPAKAGQVKRRAYTRSMMTRERSARHNCQALSPRLTASVAHMGGCGERRRRGGRCFLGILHPAAATRVKAGCVPRKKPALERFPSEPRAVFVPAFHPQRRCLTCLIGRSKLLDRCFARH